MSTKEKFLNVPNALSLYRLLSVPVILFLTYQGREQIVGILIAISLITDMLDGIIARAFKLQTKIGALLDSWADMGIFACSFYAIAKFKWHQLQHYSVGLIIFFVLLILSYAAVFIKFGKLIGLHTYLFKLTGYLQGIFIILLFLVAFYPWLFYMALFVGCIACIEEIIIIKMLKEPRMNVKGLYWLLKDKQAL